MRILNRELQREFATPGRCELCGVMCAAREGHHLRSRSPEITVRINLISLGSSAQFQCKCHHDIHWNGRGKADCVVKVCVREKCTLGDRDRVMELIWRAPKASPRAWFEAEATEWSRSALALLRRTLDEANITEE